ncbi:MAG: universal stress protein [Deltaproteobacteria bacterium]|nr:universal stress protein [Deltaproteobacteria bacterium]
MRWIVGLDLSPLSQGALHFARWLGDTSRAAGGEAFVGVHVLGDEHLRVVLRYHHLDEVNQAAEAEAGRALQRSGAAGHVGEVRVVQGPTAEEGLLRARSELSADALLIGRAGKRGGLNLVRLGSVARHLLLRASCPLVVVPPDLEVADIGAGPVVALTRIDAESIAPCRFAAALAARLGRGLALLHVVPLPDEYGAGHLPADTVGRLRRELLDEGQQALGEWAAAQGLGHAEAVVRQGSIVEEACAFAVERGAPLLVAGSHPRGAVEGVLASGVGVDLAGAARCPVAVVPATPAPEH